jgi:tetratricopeptide (TPR) repeat protein
MRRGLLLAWLVAAAGCSFNPGAAQQALMQANMATIQKDYAGAIGLYDQALANDPSLLEARFYRGVACRGNGDYDQALADIDQSIKMGLRGSRVFTERARVKLEKLAAEAAGDKDKLSTAFAKEDPLGISADLDIAIRFDGMNTDGTALLLRGAVRLMQGRDAEAQKDFDRYLIHRPGARSDLDDAIKKWKAERPALDLVPIDDLGRLPTHRLSHAS